MFGIPSLQKLLVLAAVVAAVWYGFKLIGRLQEARKTDAALRRNAKRKPRTGATDSPEAEDMVQCPVCQAFVQARGAAGCGRGDCPY
jgi:uncharacterized protein